MRVLQLIAVNLSLCVAASLGTLPPSKAPSNQTIARNGADLSCFAKIRFATSIQPDLRQQLDRMASIAALDQISLFLQSRAIEMCAPKERAAVESFLESHSEAIQIADSIAFNFTNSEKDLLNVWANLNDTESERRFYLSKFHRLSEAKQTALRDSFGQIFDAYLRLTLPPPHFIKFFTSIAPKELHRLKHLEDEEKEDEMRKVISANLQRANLTATESADVRQFMNGVFHLL